MTDKEPIGKVHSSMYNQCKSRDYADRCGYIAETEI